MAELDHPKPAQRRTYRKPAVRRFGGLAELTRMAVSTGSRLDGGTNPLMRRTG